MPGTLEFHMSAGSSISNLISLIQLPNNAPGKNSGRWSKCLGPSFIEETWMKPVASLLPSARLLWSFGKTASEENQSISAFLPYDFKINI